MNENDNENEATHENDNENEKKGKMKGQGKTLAYGEAKRDGQSETVREKKKSAAQVGIDLCRTI